MKKEDVEPRLNTDLLTEAFILNMKSIIMRVMRAKAGFRKFGYVACTVNEIVY
jgi:hypothetical protein